MAAARVAAYSEGCRSAIDDAVEGLDADTALQAPFLAIGMHDDIANHLLECRRRWGISYFTVRAPIPDGGVFVVRGDELNRMLLAEDASRFRERFSEWAKFGISAFYAATEDEIDAICQTRLVRFASLRSSCSDGPTWKL